MADVQPFLPDQIDGILVVAVAFFLPHPRTVFDAVGAGNGAVQDAFGPVGVGGDPSAQAVGVPDEGRQRLGRILGAPHVAVRGQSAAGRADLDPVHTHRDHRAHGLQNLLRAVRADPHVVEVPRRRGDGQAAGKYARPVQVAPVDGPLQRQGHAEHVGAVPNGRHPAPQGASGVPGGLDDGLDGALARQGRDAVLPRVHDEMYVGVDEAGEQRGRTQVDDLRVTGNGKVLAGTDGLDPVAVHQNQSVGNRRFALPVDDRAACDGL